MVYKVFRTSTFQKEFDRLSSFEKRRIHDIEKKLSENPFVGKPLGRPFLREKRLNAKRILYLVHKDFVVVLMVAISTKKLQQSTIDFIMTNLDSYAESIKRSPKNI